MSTTISARVDMLNRRLAYEIDVMDAFKAQREQSAIIVDTRRQTSWNHGHVTGSVHLPSTALDDIGEEITNARITLIVYGWGPGCNGATCAALELLQQGFDVREMTGGIEYWIRNGLPIEGCASSPFARTAVNVPEATAAATETVSLTQPADPLVTAGA